MTASENLAPRSVAEQRLLYFGTGRWQHDFLDRRVPACGRLQAATSGSFRAVQLQNSALPTELGMAVITSLRHTLVTACAGPFWHTAFIAQVMSIAVSSPV